MAYDFKKEYKEYYHPAKNPAIINIPEMKFLALKGKGNPNAEDGDYQRSIKLLYGLSYTLKMSHKGGRNIRGFFEYVVPPLEGFWWQEENASKDGFQWISLIRLPDFITEEDVLWAKKAANEKKKMDFSAVEFLTYNEGLCVQCMHVGPFDEEPETIERMEKFADKEGYQIDISENRYHHEIYLSDPRKCVPKKRKTVIRQPVTLRG